MEFSSVKSCKIYETCEFLLQFLFQHLYRTQENKKTIEASDNDGLWLLWSRTIVKPQQVLFICLFFVFERDLER